MLVFSFSYADRPVVIVVSMDGLQADLIQQTTALRAVAKAGLHASHMRPVFPTATFPNHYSIVTGLHPESHGIIDNMFSNADFSDTFAIWNNSRFQSTWWKGRPIWQVAQEQGLRVSAHYWPGSDVGFAQSEISLFGELCWNGISNMIRNQQTIIF
jgi:predicted AlkP superfamily pyrophosphatase or phosphodiesterase